jgi:COP9 signalosome complex subunit 4
MENQIAEAVRNAPSRDLLDALKGIIDRNAQQPPSSLMGSVQRLLADDVPVQISRAALAHFATVLKNLPAEAFEEVANFTLSKVKASANNYDETDFILRDHLCSLYLGWNQFSDAAATLAGLNLDSTTRPYSDFEKANTYVKCAEAYLADDSAIDAEVFVNKARTPMENISEWTLQLRYKAVLARILDANRKFTEAAKQYYELSTMTHPDLVQDDLLELYVKAVTCNILGKTGAQRTRNLGLLYKDPRLESISLIEKYTSHPIILEKMFKEQIVRKDEVIAFELCLLDHQKATTSDGFTFLEKAIIEHNMLAIGKIYDNIQLPELTNILLIDERRTQRVAAAMIAENRLRGYIDQSVNALIFTGDATSKGIMDAEVLAVCESVTRLVDSL